MESWICLLMISSYGNFKWHVRFIMLLSQRVGAWQWQFNHNLRIMKKTKISHSSLIRQRFQGYRCESDMRLYKCRATFYSVHVVQGQRKWVLLQIPFFNLYTFATQDHRTLLFRTMNSVYRSISLSFKYLVVFRIKFVWLQIRISKLVLLFLRFIRILTIVAFSSKR